MIQLVLASQSPRRKEILGKAGYVFVTRSVETEEKIDPSLPLQESMKVISIEKARAVAALGEFPKALILSADTLVILDGKTLGKPRDANEARVFLERLSGRHHLVWTSFSFLLTSTGQWWSELVESKVSFHTLSGEQIQKYIETGEPMDKAGAYGIQGLGGKFVSGVEGSWENVMGLPIQRIEQFIQQQGWQLERRSSI